MISNYISDLKHLRNWTQRAANDLTAISTLGLPIVSPMRDLAVPEALIEEELKKITIPDDPKELLKWNELNKSEEPVQSPKLEKKSESEPRSSKSVSFK